MNTIRIASDVTKNFPHSNLFISPEPLKIKQELPDQFGSALIHEIRNPLTTINLAVQMLRSPARSYESKLYEDIIMRSSTQINDLISDLLRSWQANEIQTGNYPIHQLVDEALALAADRIILKTIVVEKDYTSLDCKVLVNKQKIKIALANIIINAIEAMPSGNGKLKLITRSINKKCVIEIKDNGIGISQKNLSKIFLPYFTGKVGGMGLGLSTTMDILLANHVTTDVRSVEGHGTGHGTRFILSFERIQLSGECLLEK
jgi:signal transduction histidine kinase